MTHRLSRRTFLGTGLCAVAAAGNSLEIRWQKAASGGLFENALCGGMPLVFRGTSGLLTASISVEPAGGAVVRLGAAKERATAGGVDAVLRHRLARARNLGGEDVLEAEVRLRNTSSEPRTVTLSFLSAAHPGRSYGAERAHFPFTAGKHLALAELGLGPTRPSDQLTGNPGQNAAPFTAYYREPAATDPATRTTAAMLLIPLADIWNPGTPWRMALFASPERPWAMSTFGSPLGDSGWSVTTRVTLAPGAEVAEKCWLLLHDGGPEPAWKAFHALAHHDPLTAPGWLHDAKVHYFDFLSPGGTAGQRGGGYDEDAAHFREFRVGMATQHGYYPFFGDYIHPDRKQWRAMPADAQGPAEMSLERMRARCRATRAAGAKAAIYLHTAGFDSASGLAASLADAVGVGPDGKPLPYPWRGPDTAGDCWHMSIAAPAWRNHLLRQAQWIMELIAPDAIVLDETFAGLGYDHHPSRPGVLSHHMIGFLRDLRRLIRRFGSDKALLTSDCGLGAFVLWADGEGGDHAYGSLLGQEEYRKAPVRYLAALGSKRWLPCAWQFTGLWEQQMDLAKKTGAGVGVSNGWIEYTGLAALGGATRERLLRDISSL